MHKFCNTRSRKRLFAIGFQYKHCNFGRNALPTPQDGAENREIGLINFFLQLFKYCKVFVNNCVIQQLAAMQF